MAHLIHPTALVDPAAVIGNNVTIGPYSTVGPHVTLADDITLVSHVAITGRVSVGMGSTVYPFAVLGTPPQFIKGALDESCDIMIGQNVTIREHVTINPGTPDFEKRTVVGDNCYIMIGAHIGHDCHLGKHVVLTNNVSLGGHCVLGNWVIIGGLSGVHQFVRVGDHAIVGGMSGVENDVIPYGSVFGNRARLNGLNIIGLKRRGFSRDAIHDLRNAYRLLFANEGTLAERIEDVAELFVGNKPVMEIINFIRAESTRSLCLPEM